MVQLLGYIGTFVNLVIYQQKTGMKILLFKLISDIIWAVHYLLLGAISGFCIAAIGIVRESVFMIIDRNSKAGKIWLVVFACVAVISAAFTWKSVISFLPATASVISVISFFFAKPKLSRILSFPISLCMGIYSFSSGSYAGVTNEILTVISSCLGMLRLDKNNKEDKKC